MLLNYILNKSIDLISAKSIYVDFLMGQKHIRLANKIIAHKVEVLKKNNPQAEVEILHAQLKLKDALNDICKICTKYNL